MSTRNWLIVVSGGAAFYAAYQQDLAAIYIALAWGGISILLHAIEVKLNRLLDRQGISVPDYEIAADR